MEVKVMIMVVVDLVVVMKKVMVVTVTMLLIGRYLFSPSSYFFLINPPILLLPRGNWSQSTCLPPSLKAKRVRLRTLLVMERGDLRFGQLGELSPACKNYSVYR